MIAAPASVHQLGTSPNTMSPSRDHVDDADVAKRRENGGGGALMGEDNEPVPNPAEQTGAQQNQPNPHALRRPPIRERKGRDEKRARQWRVNEGRLGIVEPCEIARPQDVKRIAQRRDKRE